MRLPWRRVRWVAAALAAAACGLTAAGCGVPTEATAHALAGTRNVDTVEPVTTTTATATRVGTVPIPVFFIGKGGDDLVSRTRYVKVHPGTAATTAVDVLLTGPSTLERYSLGDTTALARGVQLVHANLVGHVITLNFNTSFGNLSGPQELLGVAQVVFTVTHAVTTNDGVVFEINDFQIPVPVASGGGLQSQPVHQSNYASLLAPPLTSPTTTTSS